MKSEQHFRITYDGPALQSHIMDVRELAPALLSMADLLKAASAELHGDKAEVRVAVNASFKSGSFGIDMVFFQSVMQQLTDIFSGKEASAAANSLQILSSIGLVGGGGLIGALSWLKRRKIERIEQSDNKATLYTVDESTEIDLVTLKLLQSRRVRCELRNVLRPLESDGIDAFATSTERGVEASIMRQELEWFDAPADGDTPLSDAVTRGVILQIESAVFKDGNKWRFTDGSRSFFASIEDVQFLSRIDAGEERFGKSDILVVDLRQLQFAINGELKSEYRIEKVAEHRAPLQKPLI